MIATAYGSDAAQLASEGSRGSPQPRGEGAVGAVTLRQHAQQPVVEHRGRHGALRRRIEPEVRMLAARNRSICSSFSSGSSEQVLYTSQPPGFTTVAAAAKDRALDRRHHREVRHLQAPARVGMPAERARSGARRVDEHDINRSNRRKARVRRRTRATKSNLETLHVLHDALQARRARDRSRTPAPALRDSSTDFPPGAAQRSATVAPVGTHAYCVTSVDAGSWR